MKAHVFSSQAGLATLVARPIPPRPAPLVAPNGPVAPDILR